MSWIGLRTWIMAALIGAVSLMPPSSAAAQAPTKGKPAQTPGVQSFAATDLVPGAKITVDLPALGGSLRSGGALPVQMTMMLPSNYDRKIPHPVLLHFGGEQGYPDPKTFSQLSGGKHFICVGVDFSTTNSAYQNAHAVINILTQATQIDRRSIFLGGSSNGAFRTTGELGTPLAAPFAGFICLIGGDAFAPQALGRRPILWYIGEKDQISNIDLQAAAHAQLKAAGCDTTFIVEAGGVHDVIIKTLKPQFQEWIYARLPAVQEVKLLEAQLAKAKTDAAKLVIYRKLAQSWLDLPIVAEAKQMAAAAAPETPPPAATTTAPEPKPTATAAAPETKAEEKKPVAGNPLRTWTDATGQFRIEATLLEVKAGQARLKKADGKIIEVPLEKLSLEDRKYAESL